MTKQLNALGFMQGRLSPMVGDRIQAFPAKYWESEFTEARHVDLKMIEWTIDSLEFLKNPLVTTAGQKLIRELCKRTGLSIPSVTCDYFMENPFWDAKGMNMLADLTRIIEGMEEVNARILVIPLVDNSSIKEKPQGVRHFFKSLEPTLNAGHIQIAFELDLPPKRAGEFINEFPEYLFGVNYDIGNSASLGYDPAEEISVYGNRVLNVHVKDRLLGGKTVRLGEGAADFYGVVQALARAKYNGNYIFQTARASDNNHTGELKRNIQFFEEILQNAQ